MIKWYYQTLAPMTVYMAYIVFMYYLFCYKEWQCVMFNTKCLAARAYACATNACLRAFVVVYLLPALVRVPLLPKLRSFTNSSPCFKAVSMSGYMADAVGHVNGAPLEMMDDISSFLSTVLDLRFKPKQFPIILINEYCINN